MEKLPNFMKKKRPDNVVFDEENILPLAEFTVKVITNNK